MRSVFCAVSLCLGLTGCTLENLSRPKFLSGYALPNVYLGFVGQHPSQPEDGKEMGRLVLCLKELRFLGGSPGEAPAVVRLGEGEVALTHNHYELAGFRAPAGHYSGITLQVANTCGKVSAVVDNANGHFVYEGDFELTWLQSIEIGPTHTRLWLPTHTLLAASSRITEGRQIPPLLEASLRRLQETSALARQKPEDSAFQAGAGFSLPPGRAPAGKPARPRDAIGAGKGAR
jgi:hypothetical protein